MTLRIIYGVQGTGNGHITRARVMAKAFAERNDVAVDYLFSGRKASDYFDMEVFGDYRTRRGLTFVHKNGRVSQLDTLRQARPLELIKDIRSLDLSGYDLVLNDFEPVTAWAATLQKVPSIAISHQAAFSHPVPKAGQSLVDRFIMKAFAPASMKLGVHWYHFGHDIMPPFIEDQASHQSIGTHYLVYLPFEDVTDIRELLDSFPEVNFVCFHPDVAQDYDQDNVQWRRPSKKGFHDALRDSVGVIANGGFELASESLQLGKKLLIKPLQGQFEQLSNAKTLEALTLCHVMSFLDVDALESFISAPNPEPVTFPCNPQPLIDWLVAGNWQDTRVLLQSLWQSVQFPPAIDRKLKDFTLS